MFGWTTDRYVSFAGILARKMIRSLAFIGILCYVTFMLVQRIPGGFVPEEDQGYLLVNALLPDAASLERTDAVMKKAESILQKNEAIEGFNTITGYSLLTGAYSSNLGFFFVQLKPWEERTTDEAHANGVLAALNRAFAQEIPEAGVVAFGPPAIPGLGTGAGFTMELQDRSGGSPEYLAQQAARFMEAARKRPEIGRINTLYRASVPQIYADIDRSKVLKAGVPLNDVNTTLGALLGSSYINDFNRFGRVYKVYMQAEPEFRQDPKQLGLFYVKNQKGGMVPLDTLLATESGSGPEFTNRFNLFRAAEITGVPAPGFSSAQALDALEETARQVLPPDVTFDWADLSFQERRAPGVAAVFALAIFLVFLILAAQYESWGLPFSVLLGTPFAAFGAYLGLYLARLLMGPSYVNNVFAQIGLIMLIGLAAKNAILIVEFAKMELEAGKPLMEATMSAAKLRFRPILMTAFAFILGVVPLLTASGAGAEGRKVMGMTVFAGMLVATILGVCLIPMLFVFVEKMTGGRSSTPRPCRPCRLSRWQPSTDGGATEMVCRVVPHRPDRPGRQRAPVHRMPRRSQLHAAGDAVLRSSSASSKAHRRSRSPTHRGSRCSTIPRCRRSSRRRIASNLDLRAAVARVEEMRARAGVAKSFLYPQVDGVASYAARGATSGQPDDGDDEDTFHQSGTYGFQLSWELDLFGKLRRQQEAALALALASEQARRGVMVTLVGDVASSYFLLRELDVQLFIARQTLEINNQTVTYFQNRLDGGVSNRLELDRIRALRSQTAAAIPNLEQQIAVVENEISLLLGRAPGPIVRDAPTPDIAQPPPIPPGLPTSLLERRPDVAEAEQFLVAANADIGAAKALFYPTISLTGFLGGISGDLTTFLGGSGGIWSAGAGLLQPIYQGGRLRRNEEAAQARFSQALALYQKAALNGYREVANALVTIQKLAEERVQHEEGVAALVDAADLARARYESGLASYIEILTADQELFEQQLLLAQTRGEEFRARAELYRTLGGGWQPLP